MAWTHIYTFADGSGSSSSTPVAGHGQQGPPGPAGTKTFAGTSLPAVVLGSAGDLYLRSTPAGLQVWQKTQTDLRPPAWGLSATVPAVKGEQGIPGPAGQPGQGGSPGTPGAAGAPGSPGAQGNPGDPGPAGGQGAAQPGSKGDPGTKIFTGNGTPSASLGMTGDLYFELDAQNIATGPQGLKGDRGPAGPPGGTGPLPPTQRIVYITAGQTTSSSGFSDVTGLFVPKEFLHPNNAVVKFRFVLYGHDGLTGTVFKLTGPTSPSTFVVGSFGGVTPGDTGAGGRLSFFANTDYNINVQGWWASSSEGGVTIEGLIITGSNGNVNLQLQWASVTNTQTSVLLAGSHLEFTPLA